MRLYNFKMQRDIGEQDAEVANLWLLALEMTQIASNRRDLSRFMLCKSMQLAQRPLSSTLTLRT